MQTNIHFILYLSHFLSVWETLQTKVIEEIKIHILCSVTVFRKPCRLWNNVEKYCRAGQATHYNMAQAHCMLNNQGYKHTLRICNTLCFPPATLVARTRRNVTLHVHCLSCFVCMYVCGTWSIAVGEVCQQGAGETLGVRGRNCQEAGGKCMQWRFVICTQLMVEADYLVSSYIDTQGRVHQTGREA
jgi:hypothetical protein